MPVTPETEADRLTRRRRWFTAITAAGLTLCSYLAIMSMETTTANYDPQYMRVLVERTAAYGGSYYSNGIHNKGPLEPFVYSMALHLGGANGFWFVVACFTFIAACAVALAGAAVCIIDHSSTILMSCVMVVIVTHLTVSNADYAAVLYSRNMSVALLSVAFFVGVLDTAWATRSRRRVSVLVVGGAIGLAVQTLISGMFTAAAVLLWVMWWRRRERAWRLPVWAALVVVAGLVFISAPLYYRVFGPWDDFVGGFWTHARFMSEGTGRGLVGQFALGWTSLTRYYSERLQVLLPILVWAGMVVVDWRRASPAQRSMRVMLIAWWSGAWLELVLSQRYSSHYFSVLAVPTMLMFADLVARVVELYGRSFVLRPSLRAEITLLPLLCVILMMVSGDRRIVDQGIQAAAMVRSVDQFTERRQAYLAPRLTTTHAALNLISTDGDPLLMWTSYPWPYLDLHRVSATRYIWKSFLIGEIYLGATDEKYVLPGTWQNFADDVAESDPQAFLVESVTPLREDTPFAEYVDEHFSPVYVDADETLAFRTETVEQLLAPPTGGHEATLDGTWEGPASTQMCERVDGAFQTQSTTVVDVRAKDGHSLGRITVNAHLGSLAINVHRDGRIDANFDVSVGDDPAFTLFAGARSIVLMVDGRIVGALDSERDATLKWPTTGLTGPVTVSPSPAVTGCPPG